MLISSRGGMVYTTDLKSVAPRAYRFESGREYQEYALVVER